MIVPGGGVSCEELPTFLPGSVVGAVIELVMEVSYAVTNRARTTPATISASAPSRPAVSGSW